MSGDVATIADGLTKASKRALLRMSDAPCMEGRRGPSRSDVYSLWWGRDGGKDLTEHPTHMESGVWMWTLTPLGIAVRAHLAAQVQA